MGGELAKPARAVIPPLHGLIDESKITKRKLFSDDKSQKFETGVFFDGTSVLIRTSAKPVSETAFRNEYRLFERVREILQSGVIIGYCNYQTLVFGLIEPPTEHLSTCLARNSESWAVKSEWLLRWVELSMKFHALSPRTFGHLFVRLVGTCGPDTRFLVW